MTQLDASTSTDSATQRPGTWLSELRSLFTLGWPLIIAQLAQSALFTTDVVMMGWLGAKYLAAGTLATAFFICLQLFGVALSARSPRWLPRPWARAISARYAVSSGRGSGRRY